MRILALLFIPVLSAQNILLASCNLVFGSAEAYHNVLSHHAVGMTSCTSPMPSDMRDWLYAIAGRKKTSSYSCSA